MTREELWAELDEILLERQRNYEAFASVDRSYWPEMTDYNKERADHFAGLRRELNAALLGEQMSKNNWYLGQPVLVHAKLRVMRGSLLGFEAWKEDGCTVYAAPDGGRNADTRWLMRDARDMPVYGIIVGRTYRQVGLVNWEAVGGPPGNRAWMGAIPPIADAVNHRVYLVATTLRWQTPMDVLEQDMEDGLDPEVVMRAAAGVLAAAGLDIAP